MYYVGHMSGFGFIGMTLFWIIFILVIIWLILQNKPTYKNNALDIAKTRYAKGEIKKSEFEELKKEITK